MNEIATKAEIGRNELIEVLSTSLYVGAKKESIGMVFDYCAAAHLDPMQKPVHIVPMNTKNPVTGKYEFRDVIMPGIGLYRIQADRSERMAGISEPEYGEEITAELTDKSGNSVTISYPEWCRVTIKKIVGAHIVEFVAKEYWIENYATDSGRSTAPNAMWKKRPRGQIAKCAEAQALRKAFPEIGAQPTAEEMEGKILEVSEEVKLIEPVSEFMPEDDFNAVFSKWQEIIITKKQTHAQLIDFVASKGLKLSPEQIEKINKTGDDWE